MMHVPAVVCCLALLLAGSKGGVPMGSPPTTATVPPPTTTVIVAPPTTTVAPPTTTVAPPTTTIVPPITTVAPPTTTVAPPTTTVAPPTTTVVPPSTTVGPPTTTVAPPTTTVTHPTTTVAPPTTTVAAPTTTVAPPTTTVAPPTTTVAAPPTAVPTTSATTITPNCVTPPELISPQFAANTGEQFWIELRNYLRDNFCPNITNYLRTCPSSKVLPSWVEYSHYNTVMKSIRPMCTTDHFSPYFLKHYVMMYCQQLGASDTAFTCNTNCATLTLMNQVCEVWRLSQLKPSTTPQPTTAKTTSASAPCIETNLAEPCVHAVFVFPNSTGIVNRTFTCGYTSNCFVSLKLDPENALENGRFSVTFLTFDIPCHDALTVYYGASVLLGPACNCDGMPTLGVPLQAPLGVTQLDFFLMDSLDASGTGFTLKYEYFEDVAI